jgi:hypothetical protein
LAGGLTSTAVSAFPSASVSLTRTPKEAATIKGAFRTVVYSSALATGAMFGGAVTVMNTVAALEFTVPSWAR